MNSYDITENFRCAYAPLRGIGSDDICLQSIDRGPGCILLSGCIHCRNDKVLRFHFASLYLILDGQDFRASIAIDHSQKYYFLPNYKDYVILTAEERPIPKVLISSYPKSEYAKANSLNCYVSKEGDFVEIAGDDYSDFKVFCNRDKKGGYIEADQLSEGIIKHLIFHVIRRYTRLL